MLFHNFLRALMEAWGHKPKGTTVWELLKEVLQNLPFGVKKQLVEILPEQSVTGQYMPAGDGYPAVYVDDIPTDTDLFKIGVKYKVKINNTSYDVEAMSLEDNMVMLMIDEAQSISHYGGGMVLSWAENFGETITLAIYEEQEVVEPLDPKFVSASGGVVFYVSKGTGNGYIYKDADCTEKVTAEEIKALIGQSIVLSAFGESFMYVCSMMLWDNTWFELHCFNYDMTNKISYYTAEKTNNTPV